MRFLSLFLRFLAGFFLFGLIVGVAGRELLLFVAGQQVARTAQRLTQINRWQPYFSECRQTIVTETSLPVSGVQLRFLDDRQYVVEVVCVGQDPVEVENFTLPMGVRKTTGSAGFFYNLADSSLSGELTLEFFRQKRLVYAEGEKAGQQWGVTDLRSSFPASVCTAHGLECCAPAEYQGVGEAMTEGVLDCPSSCFSSCQRRPILLSFQSQPSGHPTTREVQISAASSLVIFAYTFDGQESAVQEVQIDFGDGTSARQPTSTGQFEKEFTCQSAVPCRYTVNLQAFDERGVPSAVSRLSSFTIVVTP